MKTELERVRDLIVEMMDQKAPVEEISQVIKYSVAVLDAAKNNAIPTRQEYKVDRLFIIYMTQERA